MVNGICSEEDLLDIIDRNNVIGKGTVRVVYGINGSNDFVIKESIREFCYQNFVEWIVWTALEKMADPQLLGNNPNSELKDMFASCRAISKTSKYLLMERLDPQVKVKEIPFARLPFWLNDKKPCAFGKDKLGNVKVLDYGSVNFYDALNPKNRSMGF